MTINLNSNPYFDDYDQSKNYMRVLFRPGYSVQARELTQLQTALQKQISRFGSHVFKDGSIVLNGNTNTTEVRYIDVSTVTAPSLVGKFITGNVSGAIGKVFLTSLQSSSSTTRIYFVYTNGLFFQQNESVYVDGVPVFNVVNQTTFGGNATMFSIEDSVFYVKEHFVFCNKQSIIISENTAIINAKVGLSITESIVTSAEDSTLLDPAQGSYNFSAPGADRFAITLTLTKFNYDPQNEAGTQTGDFVELSRFVNSELVYNVTNSAYSNLETNLARRTYDESGDYTVDPFIMSVKEHIYGDPTKLTIALDPGKAYVRGYEFETIATTNLDMERARDTATKNNSQFQVDFGDYILVSTPTGGVINYTANTSILLKNSSTTIGSANVRTIRYHSAGVYKLFLFNIVFNSMSAPSITSVTSGSWTANVTAAPYIALFGTGSPISVIKGRSTASILQLPNRPVKTLMLDGVTSDTSYTFDRTFDGIIGNGTTTLPVVSSGSASQTFPSNTLTDYILVNQADGSTVAVTGVSGAGTGSVTLTVGSATSATFRLYTRVSISTAAHKNKTVNTLTENITFNALNKLYLKKPDCLGIQSITAKDLSGTTNLPELDVTGQFEFNNGQTDDFYDQGWIKLKSGSTINPAYDTITVVYSYFEQSSSVGFFTADSYALVAYRSIPSYVSSTGVNYNLRDCIDFRARREDGPGNGVASTSLVGSAFASLDSFISVDYSYYLSRCDKLVLTKERKFNVIKGISAEIPSIPNDMYDAMSLYTIQIPAYTDSAADVTFSYIDNKRFTMRDIGKIEKRVNRIETYTALSLLEKQARDSTIIDSTGIDRFKNGILVDSFAGHSVGDVNNKDYNCAIDPENRMLRPTFAPFSFNYVVNTLDGAVQRKDLVHLPYTTELLIEQPHATGFINLNPYMVFNWNGSVVMDPATDTWIDTQVKPDVTVNMNGENDAYTILTNNVNNPASIGTRWNDWQTVSRGVTVNDNITSSSSTSTTTTNDRLLQSTSTVTNNQQTTTTTETLARSGISISTSQVATVTRDIGNRVTDISIVPFIRSRLVKFAAKNLKPSTNLMATFDGVDVTQWCTPALEVICNNVPKTATKVRVFTTLTQREASIVLTKSDRVFVVMDPGYFSFTSGDSLQWLVNGVWTGTSTVSSVRLMKELATNEKGDIAGTFLIPSSNTVRFRTGERTFRLSDAIGTGATTAAEVKYIAQGMSQSVERTIVATRVATASINPVSEVETRSSSSTRNIVVSSATSVQDITPPIPAPPPLPPVIRPAEARIGGGVTGRHEFTIDFGTEVGLTGIVLNTGLIPDRYTITWNGNSYTSGFIGSSTYNAALNTLGFPNVTAGATPNDRLIFQKTSAFPTTAILTVDAPLAGSGWSYSVVSAATVAAAAAAAAVSLPAAPGLTEQNASNIVVLPTPPVITEAPGATLATVATIPVAQLPLPVVTPPTSNPGVFGNTIFTTPGLLVGITNFSFRELTRTWFQNGVVSGLPPAGYKVGVFDSRVQSAQELNTRYRLKSAVTNNPLIDVVLSGFRRPDGSNQFGDADTPTMVFDEPFVTMHPSITLGHGEGIVLGIVVKNGLATNTDFNVTLTWEYASGTAVDWVTRSTVLSAKFLIGQPPPLAQAVRDPVAQTFFIDSTLYPNGIFVDSIDLYFKKKSNSLPVTMQIRTTENGYPSSKTILPFAVCDKDFTEILVSDDASVATNFQFENIVHLAPGEYSMVAIADTDEYEIFTARLGDFSINDAEQRITKQPTMGSMFKSQNASTWTAVQEEDVKFRIHKCVFDTTSRTVVYDTKIESTQGDHPYDTFFTAGEVVDFASTNIAHEFKPNGGAWTSYQVGTNVTMDSTKLLSASAPSSLQYKTILSTTDVNITPIVDLNRLASNLIRNIVNFPTDGAITKIVLTNAGSGYTNGSAVALTIGAPPGGGVQATATCSIVGGIVTGVTITNPGAGYTSAPSVTVTSGSGTGATFTAVVPFETDASGGNVTSKYISRRVKLNPEFASTDLKVMFLANIPTGTAVDVYYKVASSTDTVFDDNAYVKMVVETASTYSETGYAEYKYKTANGYAMLSVNDRFDTFAVKIVMKSNNSTKVPTIRDLRVIALDA